MTTLTNCPILIKVDSLLIKDALLIATMDDGLTEIRNGHVYIRDRQIAAVGYGHFEGMADKTIDATDKVVLPGLVNTHHHFFQTLTRNLPAVQEAPLFKWLTTLYEIWRELSAEAAYTSAKVALAELLLSGCTTTSDHLYLFPKDQSSYLIDEEIKAAKELGIRFHPTRGSMSKGHTLGGLPPDDIVQTEEKILQDCRRLIEKYHDADDFSMCRIALAPCAPFSVTSELMRATVELARDAGLRCHTHLAETRDEERYCLETYGCRPVEYLESLGWLGADVWLAHCIHLNDGEIQQFAETGTGVAHCPTSNLRLGSGIARVPEMLQAGVPVGLAVDGSASNDTSNLLMELRQGLLVHRLGANKNWLTARDLFWLATRGGAKLLGRTDIGSIEVGKAADLILIDTDKLSYAGAMNDPLAAVLFSNSNFTVHTTIVNGKVVVQDGTLVPAAVQHLIRAGKEMAARLLATANRKSDMEFGKLRKPFVVRAKRTIRV
ncbi:MAG: 8-oxoguanine deaminase [bacterium]